MKKTHRISQLTALASVVLAFVASPESVQAEEKRDQKAIQKSAGSMEFNATAPGFQTPGTVPSSAPVARELVTPQGDLRVQVKPPVEILEPREMTIELLQTLVKDQEGTDLAKNAQQLLKKVESADSLSKPHRQAASKLAQEVIQKAPKSEAAQSSRSYLNTLKRIDNLHRAPRL